MNVAFREDASQVRKDGGPANLACIKRLVLTQPERETNLNAGIKTSSAVQAEIELIWKRFSKWGAFRRDSLGDTTHG